MKNNHTAAATFFSAFAILGACALNSPFAYSAEPVGQNTERSVQRATSEHIARPGIVTLKTSSDRPLSSLNATTPCASLEEANRVIDAVSKYIVAAKKDYSPRFGARTGAVRERLVAELEEYVKYAEEPGHADVLALSSKLQLPALIALSEESPMIFRGRLAAASEALSEYARTSKKSAEREKSLAVLMEYYLAVFEASDPLTVDAPAEVADVAEVAPKVLTTDDDETSTIADDLTLPEDDAVASDESAEEETATDEVSDDELEREKRECFEYFCDVLEEEVRAYFRGEGNSSIDGISSALGEMRYYQSESPSVTRLASYLHEVFCGPNFYLETSERFLSAFTYRDVTENFGVNENIRGTQAQGAGTLYGHTFMDVKPSENRALMSIALKANATSRTVGENRGVFIHADNLASVSAVKSMFLNPNGLITTTPAVASANMKTTVRGINTDRITLLGGKIIQNKVNQELPASERDGAERMKARVAKDLDVQANAQINEMNRRVEHMGIGTASSMIKNLTSRSSEDRLYLSCVFGRGLQFSVPEEKMDTTLSALREKNAPRKEYVAAKTAERDSQLSMEAPQGPFRSALASLAPNLHNNQIMSTTSRSALPRLEPLKALRAATIEKKSDAEPDVVVRFHQSAPNNAATIALAGALFGPGYDTLDNVILRFPGVDPEDVKKLLVPYEPQGVRDLDPEDKAQKIFTRFDEVQPFSTCFEDGCVKTVLRISSCDVDGKEWGPIEVRMTYRLEKRGDKFAFVRDELEVLPGGYQEGDSVSARFYTFRRICLKRLETTINEEYVFSPLPVDTIVALENRGSLVPKNVEVDDGWITVEFDLAPVEESEEDENGSELASRLAQ